MKSLLDNLNTRDRGGKDFDSDVHMEGHRSASIPLKLILYFEIVFKKERNL